MTITQPCAAILVWFWPDQSDWFWHPLDILRKSRLGELHIGESGRVTSQILSYIKCVAYTSMWQYT